MTRQVNKSYDHDTSTYELQGLYACGYIQKRTRRKVPKDNPTLEIVTYELKDNENRSVYVDDFEPNEYYEVGSLVNLPVYVKPYQRKTGQLSYTLCVVKNNTNKGEEF